MAKATGRPADDDQRRDLQRLEGVVAVGVDQIQAMIQAGQALAEIRQRSLYRLHHAEWTWEAYVTNRFSMSVRRADQIISFSVVQAAVEAACEKIGTTVPILPERAVRPLAGMDSGTVEAVLVEAAAAAGGISSRSIRDAAARRRPARRGVPRAVRLRVPGGTVVVEISRKGAAAGYTAVTAIEAALEIMRDREAGREAAA